VEYKFNIYASFPTLLTGRSLSKGTLRGRHWEGARVRESLSARGDEWLYKLAAPYQPFERGSRINLIWRVVRFVFEGPVPGLAADRSRIPRGCWWWWWLRSQPWFSLSRLPLRATKTTWPDVTMPPPSASLPFFHALVRCDKSAKPSLQSAKI